ncbi:MAG TPA: hypothetical protein DIT28_07675 [Oxalobacteraceae bacterium]|nr:hypothetical protein [Oxalobacteraceae bacterium]HCN89044.1 hypothetical protein [Oxalobacteraceae bacterium]
MANQAQHQANALAQQKAQLVAQGAAYRSSVRAAQLAIKADLSVDALTRSALGHVVSAAYAAFRSRTGIAGANLQTLLPLVIGGVSALSKRSLLRPVLRVALLLGAAATVVAVVAKRKTTKQGRHDAPD